MKWWQFDLDWSKTNYQQWEMSHSIKSDRRKLLKNLLCFRSQCFVLNATCSFLTLGKWKVLVNLLETAARSSMKCRLLNNSRLVEATTVAKGCRRYFPGRPTRRKAWLMFGKGGHLADGRNGIGRKARIMESQNDRTVWVGKDLKDHLVPTPSMGRDTSH